MTSFAAPLGELHGVGADVTGGPVDEHALGRVRSSVLEDHLPRGAGHDRHGRGLDEPKPLRLSRDHRSPRRPRIPRRRR